MKLEAPFIKLPFRFDAARLQEEVEALPAEAWDRRGVASDKPFSVRALAYLAAGHVAHHLEILDARYGI